MDESKKADFNEESFLHGYFQDDLPQSASKQIRIFLCSTFDDFKIERNYLIEHVYNHLRNECFLQFQKDLQLIDMRWGLSDEVAKRHLTTEICLNQVEQCLKESLGPRIVALISHRYGTSKLPRLINAKHFGLIKYKTNKTPYKHLDNLLDYCYVTDENCTDREYKLRDVEEIIKNLHIDINEWEVQEKNLNEIICKTILLLENDVTSEEFKQLKELFLTGVTEREIQLGILNRDDANDKSVVIFRNIENMSDADATLMELHTFTEENIREQENLKQLKSALETKLSLDNKHYFNVDWTNSEKFQEPINEYMKQYLKELSEKLKNSIMHLIYKNQLLTKLNECAVDSDLLYHSTFCNKMSKLFIDRNDLTKKIKKYLDDDSTKRPFIISGSLGSGKTTLMAHIAKNLRSDDDDDIVLVRFLGTSRKSLNIKSVMVSLINQINSIFKINESIYNIRESTFSPNNSIFQLTEDSKYAETKIILKDYLVKTLSFVAKLFKNPKQKLIIVLDAIDQLSKNDYNLEWMIYELPKNVKMFFSVLSDYENILPKIRKYIKHSSNHLEIKQMEVDHANKMIVGLMNNNQRKLNNDQQMIIDKCLITATEINVLYVKLLFDVSSKWTSSYSVPSEFEMCTSADKIIKYMFKHCEKLFGEIVFSRIVFYLTLFEFNGISESELEDILSIDDDLLDKIYVNYHPTSRRFPISILIFVKNELASYLVQKENDEIPVVSWLHRVFIETSQEYYANMFKSSENKDLILANVIEYFTERWCSQRSNGTKPGMKEFKYDKQMLDSFMSAGYENMYLAYRNTKPQNIKLKGVYNKRKLNELINVIGMLYNVEKKIHLLKEFVYFNYEFMTGKAELKEMKFVIDTHDQLVLLKNELGNSKELAELIEVSQIYINEHQKIQSKPTILCDCVLRRLESRSKYVANFVAIQKLMLLKPLARKDFIRPIFITDYINETLRSEIQSYQSDHIGPHLYVAIRGGLYIVNSVNGKVIGFMDLKDDTELSDIKIVLTEKTKNYVGKLRDMHGVLYFHNGSKFYSSTFDNNPIKLMQFDERPGEILLLNKDCLLITFRESFKLIKLKDFNTIERIDEIKFDINEIGFLESTIPKDTVFKSEFLESINFIYIIIGLLDGTINIYKFITQTNQLCLLSTLSVTKNLSIPFWLAKKGESIINYSYLLTNLAENESSKICLEFVIQSKDVVKIIKVSSDGAYSVDDEINKSKLNITDFDQKQASANVQLIAFYKNKLILKQRLELLLLNLFVYDLESKNSIKMETKAMDILYLGNDIILEYNSHVSPLYVINETSLKLIGHAKIDNKYKNCIIRNGKLLEMSYSSINEHDYAGPLLVQSKEINIETIYFVFDEKYIFVNLKRDDQNYEFAIIDVTGQNILKKQLIDEADVRIIAVNKDFIVINNKTSHCLYIYKAECQSDDGLYDIRQSYKLDIDNVKSEFIYSCSLNSNKFIIGFHGKEAGLIEMRFIEYMPVVNEFNESKYSLNISQIGLNKIILKYSDKQSVYCILYERNIENKVIKLFEGNLIEMQDFSDSLSQFNIISLDELVMTSLHNYLVLLVSSSDKTAGVSHKQLIYVDIKNNKIVDTIQVNVEYTDKLPQEFCGVYCVENSNGVILTIEKSIVFVDLVKENNVKKLKLTTIKDCTDGLFWTKVQKNYLIIERIQNYEIYKLDKFLVDIKLPDPLVILKRANDQYFLSSNNEYFIIKTYDLELLVYDIKSNDGNEICCLQLESDIYELVSNDKYICITTLDRKLLTYSLLQNS